MSVQKTEKYCARCTKYRPSESEINRVLVNVSEEEENEDISINFCPDCGERLSVRECHDDLDQSYAICGSCKKEIESEDRFCMYCGRSNPHYNYGRIPLVRCRRCQPEDTPEELIDEGRSCQFCSDCGDELERVDLVMSACECGNLLEPWQKFCEQCRQPNKAYKTDEKILEIFDADD